MLPTLTPAETDLRKSHRERIERHMATLARVAEMAVRMAERQERRAEAAEAAEAAGAVERKDRADAAMLFDRAARAVRQTVALEARLSEGLIRLEKDGADAVAPWAESMAAAAERVREKLRQLAQDDDDDDEDENEGEAADRSDAGARERLADRSEDEDFELEALREAAAGRRRGGPDGPQAAAGPLHQPSAGPPPPMGEELGRRGDLASIPPQMAAPAFTRCESG